MKRRKYTEEDYIQRCKELGLEYVGTHKEPHDGTIIEFICSKHRDKGVQYSDWGHFRVSAKGCPYCTGRYKTTDEILPLIKNKDVEIISEYLGNEKPIECRCRKCNNTWTTLPKVLITNGSGCPECGNKKKGESQRKSHDVFVEQIAKIDPNIEILETYTTETTKIKCRCKIDGTIWYGLPRNMLAEGAGCPTCSSSKNERRMVDALISFGLNIHRQKSFDDCKYKNVLRFDAYDPDNRIVFEYNGEQHYKPVDFAGKGKEWARNSFETNKERDNVKRDYCKANGINMVEVPYWEKTNIKTFLQSKLIELGVINN